MFYYNRQPSLQSFKLRVTLGPIGQFCLPNCNACREIYEFSFSFYINFHCPDFSFHFLLSIRRVGLDSPMGKLDGHGINFTLIIIACVDPVFSIGGGVDLVGVVGRLTPEAVTFRKFCISKRKNLDP